VESKRQGKGTDYLAGQGLRGKHRKVFLGLLRKKDNQDKGGDFQRKQRMNWRV